MDIQYRTRVCGTCKNELPENETYFLKKVNKWKRVDGSIGEKISFRSDCVKCCAEKTKNRYRAKRYVELKCTPEDYKETWVKESAFNRTKYKELIGISKEKAEYIKLKIRKGYVFISIEQYKKDKQENIRLGHIKRRKHNYINRGPLSQSEINNAALIDIDKSRVANMLRIKTKDLPDEIYESIKLNRQLKRVLGMTHSTKPERNINNKYKESWKQSEI